MSGVTPLRWVDEPLTRKNCSIVSFRTPRSSLAAGDAVEIRERLDRALAVRRAGADDHRAVVVLQRAGEDLRRRRAELIDQHDDRTVEVGRRLLVVAEDLLLAAAVPDLDDRALIDQLAGDLDGVAEQATAVAADVEHDAGDLLRLHLVEQPVDVLARVRVPCAAVEARQVDVAERRRALALEHRAARVGSSITTTSRVIATVSSWPSAFWTRSGPRCPSCRGSSSRRRRCAC